MRSGSRRIVSSWDGRGGFGYLVQYKKKIRRTSDVRNLSDNQQIQ